MAPDSTVSTKASKQSVIKILTCILCVYCSNYVCLALELIVVYVFDLLIVF